MLKLKLQYFGHLMRRVDSFENTLMLGKTEGRRRGGWQRMRWLDGITTQWTWVWASSGHWWWTGNPGVLQAMGSQRVGPDWATELSWYALGYPANPVSLFILLLAFPEFLSNPLDHSYGSPHSCLGARNRWWLWNFLFIDTVGDIFISHTYI